jgi:hypothetical protein
MGKYAVLIDTTSIQKYVFGSNKLKENLGASYLVSELYYSMIDKNDAVKGINYEEGYKGGGNALLFFEGENGKENAEKFVSEWTRSLLVLAPGINVATAIDEWKEKEIGFTKARDALFNKLRENKSRYIPQTITQRHGISAECQSDGYSMDIWSESYNDNGSINKENTNYVSAATYAKLTAYKKAKGVLESEYKELLKNKFCFTGELNKLGQSWGSENHIAIVHIDGNSMGDRFKSLKTLEETKKLSKDVEKAVRESFNVLLTKIIEENLNETTKDYLNIIEGLLPIRSIIMGGDDITFVCDGRMGIYYAKIFMEAFQNRKDEDGKNLELTSCAGIAVIKTNYPFYKGYQLAEELCANAKSKRREMKDRGSWLDFHIAYGGFSGELSDIRKARYRVNQGSLIYRPYKILDSSEFSFETFIANAQVLKSDWPNNKIKELREILTLDKAASGIFINEMNARELLLPDICKKGYNSNLFLNDKTPYFDMIELLEYYPEYKLRGV